jgi:ATP-dependent Lon protease
MEEVMNLPAVALRGLCVLPKMAINFDVSRERSKEAVQFAMLHGQKIFLVTQKSEKVEKPEAKDIYNVGVIADIKQMVKLPGGQMRVLAVGKSVARIISVETSGAYLEVEVEELENGIPEDTDEVTREAMLRILKEEMMKFLQGNQNVGKEVIHALSKVNDIVELMEVAPIHMPFSVEEKQTILEILDFLGCFHFQIQFRCNAQVA